MSSESDFLKPVSEQALRESEIVAMRTLSSHIEGLVQQMGILSTDMREVRDKVLQFEAAKLEVQINQLRNEITLLTSRVLTLELQKASNAGAKSLATGVREWLPAAVMLGAALLFWFKHV